MELLGGIGALAVLIVSAWVGGRMLLRRRGTASPEFLLGASLFLGGVFALPLSMAGASAELPVGMRVGLGMGGQLATLLMTVLQASFVWVVFRRQELWAKLLVALIAAGYVGLIVAQLVGPGLAAYFVEERGPLRWNHIIMQVMYLWASLEPVAYQARIRRQLRIGLGHRGTADRMLLWGLANSCSFVSNGSIGVALLLVGINPLQTPAFLAWIGILAAGSSVCLWAAFLAPAGWLERRHAAAGATG